MAKKSAARENAKSPTPLRMGAAERGALAGLATFAVLRAGAATLGTQGGRFWGLDFAWYLHTPLVVVLLWAPLVLLLPFGRGAAARLPGTRSPAASAGGRLPWSRILAASAAAAVLAWMLPVAFAFLGDGSYYAAELYRAIREAGYTTALLKPTSWLSGHLLEALARLFGRQDIGVPFRVFGAMAAFLGVALSLRAMRGIPRMSAWAIAASFLGGAGSLLFFGYIEVYALAYALCLAYVLTAFAALRGGIPVWLPCLLLAAALPFSLIAVIFIPSCLLLLHWRVRGEEAGSGISLRSAAWLLIALPVCAVIAGHAFGLGGTDDGTLVPPHPVERIVDGIRHGWLRYTLFAPVRVADLGNLLLLTAGGPLAMLIGALAAGWRPRFVPAPLRLFAFVAASGGLLLLVAGNAFLGYARDWDVGAFAALGLLALPAALCLHDGAPWRRAMPFLVAVQVAGLAAWVAVNTDGPASAARFEDILASNRTYILPIHQYTGYESLRKYFRSGGDMPGVLKSLENMSATGHRQADTWEDRLSAVLDTRETGTRASAWRRLAEDVASEAAHPHAPDDGRHVPPARLRAFAAGLLIAGLQAGDPARVPEYLARMRATLRSWPEAELVDILLAPGVDASVAAERAGEIVHPRIPYAFLHMVHGGLQERAGRLVAADSAYGRALAMAGGRFPAWYLVRARLRAASMGDTDGAAEVLQSCLRACPGTPQAEEARRLLAAMGR